MFEKQCLSMVEVGRAQAAILEAAAREPERPIALAIVDERGDLLAFARMDGAPLRSTGVAQRKAYTAAIMRTDTMDYQKKLRERGSSAAEAGDPMITSSQGGVVIVHQGVVVGGIGVSGNAAHRDEELARIGLKAMGLTS